MATAMAKVYYDLIKAGRWTIEQVPSKWKEEVQGMLDADNTKDADSESN